MINTQFRAQSQTRTTPKPANQEQEGSQQTSRINRDGEWVTPYKINRDGEWEPVLHIGRHGDWVA